MDCAGWFGDYGSGLMGEASRLWAKVGVACCAGCNRSGVMGELFRLWGLAGVESYNGWTGRTKGCSMSRVRTSEIERER